MFINWKEVLNFKANNKNVKFPTQLYLGRIYDGFHTIESREVSSGWNVYEFSVDYNPIDKSDILNSQKYLMLKNNIIEYLGYLNFFCDTAGSLQDFLWWWREREVGGCGAA